jgi:hypothetical protein
VWCGRSARAADPAAFFLATRYAPTAKRVAAVSAVWMRSATAFGCETATECEASIWHLSTRLTPSAAGRAHHCGYITSTERFTGYAITAP